MPVFSTSATPSDTSPLLELIQGTITSDIKAISITANWNAAGIVGPALFMNITDQLSNPAALLDDRQVGGVSKWKLDKTGKTTQTGPILVSDGTAAAPSIRAASEATGLFLQGAGVLSVSISGVERFRLANGAINISGAILQWGAAGSFTSDLALQRDFAAGVLAQRNGSNAQAFKLANTYTSTTNFEYLAIDWQTIANTCLLRPEVGSAGGTPRDLLVSGCTAVGTNTAGANLVLRGGLATGNATPQLIRLTAGAQGNGSGSTAQTAVERVVLNGTKALTSGVATSLFDITLPAAAMAGGILVYSIEATDGTDHIADSGSVYFAAVNKAGTYTTNSSILGTDATAKSDGTDVIATTFGFSNGTNKTTFQAISTLTNMTATTFRMTYCVISGSQNAITPV